MGLGLSRGLRGSALPPTQKPCPSRGPRHQLVKEGVARGPALTCKFPGAVLSLPGDREPRSVWMLEGPLRHGTGTSQAHLLCPLGSRSVGRGRACLLLRGVFSVGVTVPVQPHSVCTWPGQSWGRGGERQQTGPDGLAGRALPVGSGWGR